MERCWDRGGRDAHKGMNALSKRRGCIEVQSLDKECTTREERKGIQGLDKCVNLEPSVPRLPAKLASLISKANIRFALRTNVKRSPYLPIGKVHQATGAY
jgi:hypothetical protein